MAAHHFYLVGICQPTKRARVPGKKSYARAQLQAFPHPAQLWLLPLTGKEPARFQTYSKGNAQVQVQEAGAFDPLSPRALKGTTGSQQRSKSDQHYSALMTPSRLQHLALPQASAQTP